MEELSVSVKDNGPLLVDGNIKLLDAEGNRFDTKGQTYLCRCGLAGTKPFCDGAHKGKFESQPRAKQERRSH